MGVLARAGVFGEMLDVDGFVGSDDPLLGGDVGSGGGGTGGPRHGGSVRGIGVIGMAGAGGVARLMGHC